MRPRRGSPTPLGRAARAATGGSFHAPRGGSRRVELLDEVGRRRRARQWPRVGRGGREGATAVRGDAGGAVLVEQVDERERRRAQVRAEALGRGGEHLGSVRAAASRRSGRAASRAARAPMTRSVSSKTTQQHALDLALVTRERAVGERGRSPRRSRCARGRAAGPASHVAWPVAQHALDRAGPMSGQISAPPRRRRTERPRVLLVERVATIARRCRRTSARPPRHPHAEPRRDQRPGRCSPGCAATAPAGRAAWPFQSTARARSCPTGPPRGEAARVAVVAVGGGRSLAAFAGFRDDVQTSRGRGELEDPLDGRRPTDGDGRTARRAPGPRFCWPMITLSLLESMNVTSPEIEDHRGGPGLRVQQRLRRSAGTWRDRSRRPRSRRPRRRATR